jgi:hypothetical protein
VSALAFLLIVVVISVLGSLWVWYRQRRPTTMMSSVDDFQREMQALARDPGTAPAKRNRSRRRTPPAPLVPPEGADDRARKLRDARRPDADRREG